MGGWNSHSEFDEDPERLRSWPPRRSFARPDRGEEEVARAWRRVNKNPPPRPCPNWDLERQMIHPDHKFYVPWVTDRPKKCGEYWVYDEKTPSLRTYIRYFSQAECDGREYDWLKGGPGRSRSRYLALRPEPPKCPHGSST